MTSQLSLFDNPAPVATRIYCYRRNGAFKIWMDMELEPGYQGVEQAIAAARIMNKTRKYYASKKIAIIKVNGIDYRI